MLQNTIYNPGTQFTYIADDQTLKLYIWDNEKAGGAAATVTVRGTYEHLLVEDRDFFLYPMPGYEPYPYPHPLLEGLCLLLPNSDSNFILYSITDTFRPNKRPGC